MSAADTDTDLRIAELPLPAGAYRGLKGEIMPIENGVIIEMLDYTLRDMTSEEGRKFEGTLTTSDVGAPPFWGVWVGTVLNVDLPVTVVEPIDIQQVRPHVPGSRYFEDADGNEVSANDPRAACRCYRPRLVVMVMEPWKHSYDEWDATNGLSLKWRET